MFLRPVEPRFPGGRAPDAGMPRKRERAPVTDAARSFEPAMLTMTVISSMRMFPAVGLVTASFPLSGRAIDIFSGLTVNRSQLASTVVVGHR
jgi:hypothetical protein